MAIGDELAPFERTDRDLRELIETENCEDEHPSEARTRNGLFSFGRP
jgi:hypothetical protein